jgi:hypothetical protein
MEVRQFIRPDITVSALAHISALALVILFSEVHPFGSVTAEPIMVDLVTPDEAVTAPEPTPTPTPSPTPQLDFSQLAKPETPAATSQAASSQAAPQQAADPPQKQVTPPSRREAALQAQAQPKPQPQPSQPAPAPSPALGYTPAEPDITIKYNVMLGLPQPLPPAPMNSGNKGGDDFDATASSDANISSSVIGEFRRHLKSCSKLPATIAPSDHLTIKLRVLMALDGRLAADPLVAGGSANPKALDLLKSAIEGLKACQPYTMLPADRYGEWKVLDLNLTPRDFSS